VSVSVSKCVCVHVTHNDSSVNEVPRGTAVWATKAHKREKAAHTLRCFEALGAAHPDLFPSLLKALLYRSIFDQNQWAVSRPLLALMVMIPDVRVCVSTVFLEESGGEGESFSLITFIHSLGWRRLQQYLELRRRFVASQPPEIQAEVDACFEGLANKLEDSLDSQNRFVGVSVVCAVSGSRCVCRERFNQNLRAFSSTLQSKGIIV
jgi:hypothetical protein